MFVYTITTIDTVKKCKTKTLSQCEDSVIKHLLADKEDGYYAEIARNNKIVSIITKSKNSSHWKHDGYRFSI